MSFFMRLMKRMAQSAVFFSAFSIQITVRASDAKSETHHESKPEVKSHGKSTHAEASSENLKGYTVKAQQEPENCWAGQEGVCGLRTRPAQIAHVFLGESLLALDNKTTLVRTSSGELRLLEGQIWIQAKGRVKVFFEFGAAEVEDGEIWISRDSQSVTVSSVTGVTLLKPRGAKDQTLEVPEGMQNWLGKVNTEGVARHGTPVAIDFKNHLSRWARLFPGDREQFEAAAAEFHESWLAASRNAAEIHKSLFERKVAALRSDHEREEARKRKVELRNRELIEMFRKRVLDP